MKPILFLSFCLPLLGRDSGQVADLKQQLESANLRADGAELRGRISVLETSYQIQRGMLQQQFAALSARCGEGKAFDLDKLACGPSVPEKTDKQKRFGEAQKSFGTEKKPDSQNK